MFDSVIDPTLGPARDADQAPTTLAGRPESLAGLRLGLLANIKRNAEPFLAEVGQAMMKQHASHDQFRLADSSASRDTNPGSASSGSATRNTGWPRPVMRP